MKMIWLGILVLVGMVAGAGIVGYSYFKTPEAATGPIQAAVAVAQQAAGTDDENARVFEIQPGESQARFVIDEILQGSPKTVVGTTDQVAGQIRVDPTDADTAQIGTVLINARTFATDNNSRNRMIQNRILETDQHEYITFQPTGVSGLSDRLAIGQAIPVQIAGNLTIRGVTRPVTFDAVVTPASEDRLHGTATTTIRYADWGISIPQVPAVAGVAETVRLELDLAATATTA